MTAFFGCQKPAIAARRLTLDPRRFDNLIRTIPAVTRRGALAGLAASVLVALAVWPGLESAAQKGEKQGRRRKRGRLPRNAFGCVAVGQACRGNDNNCCSNVCLGEKPRKGKKDQSRCVAHDESTCLPGQNPATCSGVNVTCVTSTQKTGVCATTTGNAAYCAGRGRCFPCKKDKDCIDLCGAGAACVPCPDECPDEGTTCTGVEECAIP